MITRASILKPWSSTIRIFLFYTFKKLGSLDKLWLHVIFLIKRFFVTYEIGGVFSGSMFAISCVIIFDNDLLLLRSKTYFICALLFSSGFHLKISLVLSEPYLLTKLLNINPSESCNITSCKCSWTGSNFMVNEKIDPISISESHVISPSNY